MSDLAELLPPPLPERRPFPWRPVAALFVPAAALAAGTGLQRYVEGASADPLLHWLYWSSASGLAVGALAGLALRRKLLWAAYGLAAPWIVAGAVSGAVNALRPLRELAADRREAACRSEGHAVCALNDFVARCAAAQAQPGGARALLGEPRATSCGSQGCVFKWLYAGPFRPEQGGGSGEACFVQTDPEGRGLRHWLMPVD